MRKIIFGRDRRRVASLGGDAFRVWDLASKHALSVTKAELFVEMSDTVAVSPNLDRIACTNGNRVRLWNVRSPQTPLVLSGHFDTVTDLVFSSDGKRIATSSRDKSVRFWDVHTGQEVLALRNDVIVGKLGHIAISAGGSRLVSTEIESWGRTILWGSTGAQGGFSPF